MEYIGAVFLATTVSLFCITSFKVSNTRQKVGFERKNLLNQIADLEKQGMSPVLADDLRNNVGKIKLH